jgi:hypothetical protein
VDLGHGIAVTFWPDNPCDSEDCRCVLQPAGWIMINGKVGLSSRSDRDGCSATIST